MSGDPRAASPILMSMELGMDLLMAARLREPRGVPLGSVHVSTKGWDQAGRGCWRRGAHSCVAPDLICRVEYGRRFVPELSVHQAGEYPDWEAVGARISFAHCLMLHFLNARRRLSRVFVAIFLQRIRHCWSTTAIRRGRFSSGLLRRQVLAQEGDGMGLVEGVEEILVTLLRQGRRTVRGKPWSSAQQACGSITAVLPGVASGGADAAGAGETDDCMARFHSVSMESRIVSCTGLRERFRLA